MNCPICGAPLGATDNECKNCGTRRAEMGAAYNNQQNGYGYGGNTMNGGQGYGNYGMNNGGSGYGNYGMNSSFGNDSFTRTRTKSFSATKLISFLITLIVIMVVIMARQIKYNTPQTETVGDITVTFPQQVEKRSSTVFSDVDALDVTAYANRDMGFVYSKYDKKDFELKDGDEEAYLNFIFPFMDAAMSADDRIKGYKKKDQVGNHMRFNFTEDDNDWFCDMMIDFEGDSYYMYYAYCDADKENKYISKFRKMYDSIEYKK
ncbi:MAG: zinc ribbon domain-containing protein [Ruminococcus sp.]|uniref:zinc ribbon domain-containing protein n=1 Tax=Ruminococcus sp. TaxID=41978 RepID=UPI0025EA1874|nr:zinc ribbon domain-containing protein [Ruminococcus sp.]MCR5541319.1 zinc ribbon domain-containing protein [Ruminococcus sp.]